MLNDVAALYSNSPVLFAGSVFVLGLIIGSFLNVVIYRLPIMLEREWRAQAEEFTASPASSPTARTLHPGHAPLRLPGLQGPDQGLAEHSRRSAGSRCAGAAPRAARRSHRDIRW